MSLFGNAKRHKILSSVLVVAFFAVATLVWFSPPIQHYAKGPTPTEVALDSERARSADLKKQLSAAEAKLKAPRPTITQAELDAANKRAADLKAQLDDATAKLQAPDTGRVSKAELQAQAKRAADLKRQSDAATQKANAAKAEADRTKAALSGVLNSTVPTQALTSEQKRAADLKAQLDKVTAVPIARASLTKDQILKSRNLFGLYTLQSPFDNGEMDNIENAVNRDAQINGYFQTWDNDFRADAVKNSWLRNEIPLMTWESQSKSGIPNSEYSLKNIYGGKFDAYLTKYAQDIKTTGLPLIIRFDHEMNFPYYPWGETQGWDGKSVNGNAKGDYIKAWQYVYKIFQANGANDYVIWLWSPNRINRGPSQPDPINFYPGDAYVDWIGMSAYYRPYDSTPTFAETFGSTLVKLRETTRNKPIFLSEIGATELNDNKAKWFASLDEGLKANPDIIGFSYFSLTITSGQGESRVTNDWRITSSNASVDAARQMLADTEFGRPRN